jgi:hypothetical protein
MISGVKNRWSTTRQTSVPTSTTRFELWNIQEHCSFCSVICKYNPFGSDRFIAVDDANKDA